MQPSGMLPDGVINLRNERFETEPWVELGFVGFDPPRPFLLIAVCDDSYSVKASGGADPLGNRYAEMAHAIRMVGQWSFTDRSKVAVVHFDHPHGYSGVVPLNDRDLEQRLAPSLRPPVGGRGTSDLGPSLDHVEDLAQTHPDHDLVLGVASDFELTDADPQAVMSKLIGFPGRVHALLLGGNTPLDLHQEHITVTRITSSDAPGTFGAAIHRSLTATRRGARYSVLHTPRGREVLS
ncbi:hypothetical protein [Microbacterium sp. 10M-3C3]|jgi:hypothetical protein|uniref:hypothetical protein n=1 Tax=Microbacterium sp. 10M-3C3 TaxID=2483401 RepID=UPI000F631077|nr:hypothetical protein [Microbacterium sp. 10M-3C3]